VRANELAKKNHIKLTRNHENDPQIKTIAKKNEIKKAPNKNDMSETSKITINQ
jgi:hypothetical protein